MSWFGYGGGMGVPFSWLYCRLVSYSLGVAGDNVFGIKYRYGCLSVPQMRLNC
jgi:hypothetical protein